MTPYPGAMTPYLWAAVGCGVLAVIAYPVLSYLIDKPERPRWRAQGAHHRPWWWQRHRDRRQAEQDENTKTERLFEDISASISRESTGRTSSGMPRTQWPLQPLPPGVEEAADHFHRPLPPEVAHPFPTGILRYDGPDLTPGQLHEFGQALASAVAEDPLDVATPEQVADEYVGLAGQPGKNGSDEAGLTGPHHCGSLPSPAPEPVLDCDTTVHVPGCGFEPEPAPLTDYGEQTGSWEALVAAVMPKDGA